MSPRKRPSKTAPPASQALLPEGRVFRGSSPDSPGKLARKLLKAAFEGSFLGVTLGSGVVVVGSFLVAIGVGSVSADAAVTALLAVMGVPTAFFATCFMHLALRNHRESQRALRVAPAAAEVLKQLEQVRTSLAATLDAAEPNDSARILAATLVSTQESLLGGFADLYAAHGDDDLSAYAEARTVVDELEALVRDLEEERVRTTTELAAIDLAAREAGLPSASFSKLLANARDDVRAVRGAIEEVVEADDLARKELTAHLTEIRKTQLPSEAARLA